MSLSVTSTCSSSPYVCQSRKRRVSVYMCVLSTRFWTQVVAVTYMYRKQLPMNPTFVARIIGPGNVPEARVVLKYGVHWIRHRFEQQLRDAHRREYPSGANCSLTMSSEALTTEAETPRDSAARSRIKERRCSIETIKERNGKYFCLRQPRPELRQFIR